MLNDSKVGSEFLPAEGMALDIGYDLTLALTLFAGSEGAAILNLYKPFIKFTNSKCRGSITYILNHHGKRSLCVRELGKYLKNINLQSWLSL